MPLLSVRVVVLLSSMLFTAVGDNTAGSCCAGCAVLGYCIVRTVRVHNAALPCGCWSLNMWVSLGVRFSSVVAGLRQLNCSMSILDGLQIHVGVECRAQVHGRARNVAGGAATHQYACACAV
jgi:hypothetical protein